MTDTQKPVAWYSAKVDDVITAAKKEGRAKVQPWDAEHYDQPLFAAPPAQPAPAQRLTGKRIMDIAREADMDWKRGYDLDGVNRYSTFARAIEAALMPQGWACEIAEADFEQNTVTLQMAGDDYQVSAGPHMLVPLLPMPPRDAA